jgi:AraC-like DNA-binding protein
LECFSEAKLQPDGLHLLGYLNFKEALPYSIGPAKHMGTVEISYCVRGKMKWGLHGEDFWFTAGDIMITPPGIVHWGEDFHFSPIEIYWLRATKDLPFLSKKAKQALSPWMLGNQVFHFRAGEGILESFEHLVREHRNPDEFSAEICEADLKKMFLSLARTLSSQQSTTPSNSKLPTNLQKALDLMEQDTTWVLPIEDLSLSVGCPPEILRQLFRQHLGLTPIEYQNAQRVSVAKALLAAQKKSITEIAHELGFASSQYFATFFHKNIGLTPREFREQHLPNTGNTASFEEVVVDF